MIKSVSHKQLFCKRIIWYRTHPGTLQYPAPGMGSLSQQLGFDHGQREIGYRPHHNEIGDRIDSLGVSTMAVIALYHALSGRIAAVGAKLPRRLPTSCVMYEYSLGSSF